MLTYTSSRTRVARSPAAAAFPTDCGHAACCSNPSWRYHYKSTLNHVVLLQSPEVDQLVQMLLQDSGFTKAVQLQDGLAAATAAVGVVKVCTVKVDPGTQATLGCCMCNTSCRTVLKLQRLGRRSNSVCPQCSSQQ